MTGKDEELTPEDAAGVRRHAARLLADSSAIGRFPTPVPDVLETAKIILVEEKVDEGYVARLCREAVERGTNLLRAFGKVLGFCHPDERLIIIDQDAHKSRKPFLKLHETGHIYLPHQRRAFGLMLDCKHNLDPDVKELFEREANAFASDVLFQGDGFTTEAEDCVFGLRTPMTLSRKYGGSVYAAVRRYASRSSRCCAVVVLEAPELVEGIGLRAALRRIVPSASFKARFDTTTWPLLYTTADAIGQVIPLGTRRMTAPRTLVLTDRNGERHGDHHAAEFSDRYASGLLGAITRFQVSSGSAR
jgi:Zn-dependent peptidase ImmA (M78 family)